jgi:hypothetical protein
LPESRLADESGGIVFTVYLSLAFRFPKRVNKYFQQF